MHSLNQKILLHIMIRITLNSHTLMDILHVQISVTDMHFLNGSTVINSNFEIIGNAEYFVSGEGSTFYSELWSSTYSDTHVYDGGYFIGSNDFETDLTQKYKVIKIAPELYEEKSQ